MPQRVSPDFQTRRALLRQVAPCYQQASSAQKTLLLDAFVEWTGYSSKYAIVLLNHGEHAQQPIQRHRSSQYSQAVQQALFLSWKAAYWVCAKRLLPFLPMLVTLLEQHGHLCLTEEERRQLLSMSLSTAERFLRTQGKSRLHGLSATTPGPWGKAQIPVLMFSLCDEDRPGFVEMERARSLCGPSRWDFSLHPETDRTRHRLHRVHPTGGEECQRRGGCPCTNAQPFPVSAAWE